MIAAAAALTFFFVAVFGDGASAWSTHGPYRSFTSCTAGSERYAAAYAFGTHVESGTEPPATSRCYAQ